MLTLAESQATANKDDHDDVKMRHIESPAPAVKGVTETLDEKLKKMEILASHNDKLKMLENDDQHMMLIKEQEGKMMEMPDERMKKDESKVKMLKIIESLDQQMINDCKYTMKEDSRHHMPPGILWSHTTRPPDTTRSHIPLRSG